MSGEARFFRIRPVRRSSPRPLNAMLDADRIVSENAPHADAHRRDLEHLGERLRRRSVDLEAVVEHLMGFEVAVPSWALGTGGTRFGRYPGGGDPRDVFEKMEDIAVIHRLTGATPR